MPVVAKELGPLDIKRRLHPGGKGNAMIAVGGVSGLYLQITPKGGKSWILRVKVGSKRRDIGLGGYPTIPLALAREKARDARAKIEAGIDPVVERQAAKQALILQQKRGMTFAAAVDRYLAFKLDEFSNDKHRKQWRATLETYAMPHLGDMQLQEIAVQDILQVLQPIWSETTETATRLRGRIEAVLSWATVAGHRTGDNPARWGGNLKELLPAPNKIAKGGNQPALQLADAPRWFAALRKLSGSGSRCLEFAALTAARSGEARGATWDELDLDVAIWTIPAARMKMDKEHRVPLSPAAVALLDALPRFEGSELLFPSPRGAQMSDMTLSATMKRLHQADIDAGRPGFFDRVSKRPAVPHGLRSTFRDWVAEYTTYPGDMAEVALAHRINRASEASYRRGDMIEKRREMMMNWGSFLRSSSSFPTQNAAGPKDAAGSRTTRSHD